MSQLSHSDYERLLGFVERLHDTSCQTSLADWVVREVPKLVACHHCSWNDMAPSALRSSVVEFPQLASVDLRAATFSEYLLEHPGIVHYLSTGSVEPFVLSDVMSAEELHRSDLYQRLYREMGYEDQLGMMLAPPSGRVLGISLARERRGFNQRDRAVMNLLRPHLRTAHRNFEALGRAKARFAATREPIDSVALIEMGPQGKVIRGLDQALPLLNRFFSCARRRSQHGLPSELLRWALRGSSTPLVLHRRGSRLVLRSFTKGPRATNARLLLLEERSERIPAQTVGAVKGLTPREVDVLLETEKGLSTVEIAAALFISPYTAKKHLENIYTKLGVGNRTAAVYWLRQQLEESE